MRLVVIESPYSAGNAADLKSHIRYARRAVVDSLKRGEAPIASHLLYTQPGILNDENVGDRVLGINAGHAWIARADAVVLYCDYGMSAGMRAAIPAAEYWRVPLETRSIGRE